MAGRNDCNRMESSLGYLSLLALDGAIEIDNYLLGRNSDFSHVHEFAEILEKYQLKDTDTALSEPYFPYLSLWRSMRKNSDKMVQFHSELALEMRLLRSELENIPANPQKLKELRSLLCDLSREFSYEQNNADYKLVA